MGLTFLLGGARSGKSSLAVRLAASSGRPVTVIATAEARDEEMIRRIRAHRAARPAGWATIEEPLDLDGAIERVPDAHAVVLDCLSLWVSNAFEAELSFDRLLERSRRSASVFASRDQPSFVVSNEVGLGIVPMHPLGRAYRDALGVVNATWAAASDRALFVVAGRALPLLDVADVAAP